MRFIRASFSFCLKTLEKFVKMKRVDYEKGQNEE